MSCIHRSIFVCAAALLAGLRTVADDIHCNESDTPRQCMRRFQSAREAVQAALATTNSGAGGAAAPARSTLRDFLSIGSAQFDTSRLSDGGETMTLIYNRPVLRQQGQAEVTLATPRISSAAAGVAAPAIEGELSNTDDLRFSLSINAVTRVLGRSITPHRDLFERLLLPLLSPEWGHEIGGISWTSFDTRFDTIVDDASTRAEVIRTFEIAARNTLPPAAEKLAADFTSLLSNQPQLFLSAVLDEREPIVGPRVWRAMATWEIGTSNLNGFRRAEGKQCAAADSCLPAFDRYVERSRKTGRFGLSLGYDRVFPTTPEVSNPYRTRRAAGLVYSAAYSLPLRLREGRLDFRLTYDGTRIRRTLAEAASAGPAPSANRIVAPSVDRFVAVATYTQMLTKRIAAPISLVWSDRTESLPGVCTPMIVSPPVPRCEAPVTTQQQMFVVHIGLTYKFPPRAPERFPVEQTYCCSERE